MAESKRWSTSNLWILVLGLGVALILCLCVCMAAVLIIAPAYSSLFAGITPVPAFTPVP